MSSLPLTFTTTTTNATCSLPSLSSFSLLKSPSIPRHTAVFFRSSKRRSVGSFLCVFSSVEAKTMAELVKDKESIAASKSEGEVEHSRTFVDARTKQELLNEIKKEAEAGRLPRNVVAGVEELYQNYRNTVNKYT